MRVGRGYNIDGRSVGLLGTFGKTSFFLDHNHERIYITTDDVVKYRLDLTINGDDMSHLESVNVVEVKEDK